MISIDGSMGEGGGQVLRSALSLSILTGQSLHISGIRAGRSKPGLRAQHLTAVKAAARVSGAQVHGAGMGAMELTFEPGPIRPGRYRFDIPTAGAATLVLQTLFLPLSQAGTPSTVSITGGTHVPWSPCFHYLDLHWLPILRRCGYDATLSLEQAGFYPRGDGRLDARILPASSPQSLNLTHRGALKTISGISAVANLDREIANRQRRQAVKRLGGRYPLHIQVTMLPSRVKGTFILLLAEFEAGQACFFSLGAPGKPAERVADEAVDALEAFLAGDGALDPFAADQILLPLAFAYGESRLRTSKVTNHLVTNAQVLRAFLPLQVEIQGQVGEPGEVRILPS